MNARTLYDFHIRILITFLVSIFRVLIYEFSYRSMGIFIFRASKIIHVDKNKNAPRILLRILIACTTRRYVIRDPCVTFQARMRICACVRACVRACVHVCVRASTCILLCIHMQVLRVDERGDVCIKFQGPHEKGDWVFKRYLSNLSRLDPGVCVCVCVCVCVRARVCVHTRETGCSSATYAISRATGGGRFIKS